MHCLLQEAEGSAFRDIRPNKGIANPLLSPNTPQQCSLSGF